MSDISLTASVRSSLVSLKSTARLLEMTTQHLSTGKKVASAIDSPTNYFAAANYNDRAKALFSRLDGMSEATQMINAADNGITNIKAFLSQMKGVVSDALSNTDSSERRELGKQFNEIIVQVRDMAKDSSYGGVNLLYGSAANTVQFGSEVGDATLALHGFNISGAAGSLGSGGGLDASAVSNADGDTFALTIDTDGTNVIGIQSARGTETLSSGAQSIVDSANSAVTLANTFFASASANKTATLASFDTLMANAASGANEIEGSAV
jgi:flagellin-like hook-associated protein FlgL